MISKRRFSEEYGPNKQENTYNQKSPLIQKEECEDISDRPGRLGMITFNANEDMMIHPNTT